MQQLPACVTDLRLFRTFSKDSTITADVEVFLNSNALRCVNHLFSMTNLTVLSLRNNLLTSIPPIIRSLVNLRELNVANNLLQSLPKEVSSLPRLQVLVCHPNPHFKRTSEEGSLVVAPSLYELSLRRLVRKEGAENMTGDACVAARALRDATSDGKQCDQCNGRIFSDCVRDVELTTVCSVDNVPLTYVMCDARCASQSRQRREKAREQPEQAPVAVSLLR